MSKSRTYAVGPSFSQNNKISKPMISHSHFARSFFPLPAIAKRIWVSLVRDLVCMGHDYSLLGQFKLNIVVTESLIRNFCSLCATFRTFLVCKYELV
jgi:hypothetical protein